MVWAYLPTTCWIPVNTIAWASTPTLRNHMGTYDHYVNLTKHERFAADFGGGAKQHALGRTLASRAFHLMLVGAPNVGAPAQQRGRWSGDAIAIVGDDLRPDWERLQQDFTDIEANAILLVFNVDGFDSIAEAAQRDTALFMELCHLVASRQAMEIDPHMKRVFGGQYLHRYKELCKEKAWFKPKDLAAATGQADGSA